MKIQKLIGPGLIILIAALLRVVPHAPNFAPIGAMALFGGAYLDKKYALILPLLAMVVSDMFLGFSQSTPFVYGSFILIGFIGMQLKKKKTISTVIGASLASSILFFLITNFGFWLTDSLYPKTFVGQLEAYYFALPFFRNTVLGDLVYSGLFFGGYEIFAKIHYLQKLKTQIAKLKTTTENSK